jgi:uracil-DNA glycosylase
MLAESGSDQDLSTFNAGREWALLQRSTGSHLTKRERAMAVAPDQVARMLLAFYLDAGVDALLGETPVDRFADDQSSAIAGGTGVTAITETAAGHAPVAPSRSVAPHGPAVKERPQAAAPAAPAPPEAAIMAAREAARSAANLEELRAIIAAFEGCALRLTATQPVFADGNPNSRVMFVGEAPGRDEDLAGLPFVGRSGQLLDRMMAAIGLDRSCAYIANIVPWRPPGNRTPTPQESAICLPFIGRQIELANPDVLVCLGQPATQTLLGTTDGISRTRGRLFKYHTGSREISAIPTFHPAYLLRQPLQKRLAWRDFLAIKKALASGRETKNG